MTTSEAQAYLPLWTLHDRALEVAQMMRRPLTKYKAAPYGDKLREPIRCGWRKGQEF